MPSLAVAPPAQYDTFERTSRCLARTEGSERVDPAWQRISDSQVLRHNSEINRLQCDLADLSLLQDDWNGYGSPKPSASAISAASSMVSRFRALSIMPEKVSASADGGVALIFVGLGKRRAVIESFGTEDDYVLLYDTEGNSQTIHWPEGNVDKDKTLSKLQSYLRGI